MSCSQQPWCYGLECVHNETFSMFAARNRALTNHLLFAQRFGGQTATRRPTCKLGTYFIQRSSLSDPTVWSIRTFQWNSVSCSTEQKHTGWCQTKLKAHHSWAEHLTISSANVFMCMFCWREGTLWKKKTRAKRKKKNDNTARAKHVCTEENKVGRQGEKKIY